MRQKGKSIFVDEYRKIKTLQKLVTIESYIKDFDTVKKQNKNFIRFKQQLPLQNNVYMKNSLLLNNDVIKQIQKDIYKVCQQQFFNKVGILVEEAADFEKWSTKLSTNLREKRYQYKFVFSTASPPKRINEQSYSLVAYQTNFKQAKTGLQGERKEKDAKEAKQILITSSKSKYDFQAIALANQSTLQKIEHSFAGSLDKQIRQQIQKYKNFKTLESINEINSLQQQFNQFQYVIQSNNNPLEIDFVENSIFHSNVALFVDDFRNIGLPSRSIQNYVINQFQASKKQIPELEQKNQKIIKQQNNKKNKTLSFNVEDNYQKERKQKFRLSLLKPDQLKIDTNNINFFDISNIVMGRITCSNVETCIRSEKISQRQLDNLIKKLNKYEMNNVQDEIIKVDRQTSPILDAEKEEQRKNMQEDDSLMLMNINPLIDEINAIRKQKKALQSKESLIVINKDVLYRQIYLKLTVLLEKLYQLIVEDIPHFNYKLSEIQNHLQQIDSQQNKMGFQRMRLLWYVVSIYHESLTFATLNNNLRTDMGQAKAKYVSKHWNFSNYNTPQFQHYVPEKHIKNNKAVNTQTKKINNQLINCKTPIKTSTSNLRNKSIIQNKTPKKNIDNSFSRTTAIKKYGNQSHRN